jgi:enterochelin esterase-like enzyme
VKPGRFVLARFYSTALGQQRTYRAYLPPGYAAAARHGARFPVLYLLHGAPGAPSLFIDAGGLGVALDTLVHNHAIRPMIVVMPNGHDGTFRSDTEWANTPHGPYESLVLETMRAADQRFATVPDRAHRAIAGLSEGAYGALNVALHHPAAFGTVESWSGYYVQTAHGPFQGAPPPVLYYNSPAFFLDSVRQKLHRLPLWVRLYTGRHDRAHTSQLAFAAHLRASGAHVVSVTPRGGHDWRLWRDQMPASLRFAAAHTGAG